MKKIKVYRDLKSLLRLKSGINRLVIPSFNVSLFLVSKMDKFQIKEAIYQDLKSEEKGRFPMWEYPGLSEMFSKPNGLEKIVLFKHAMKEDEIHMESRTFSHFVPYLRDLNVSLKDIEIVYIDIDMEELSEVSAGEYFMPQDMNDLNDLIKLFCYFSHSELKREELDFLSKFQSNILDLNINSDMILETLGIFTNFVEDRSKRIVEDKIIESLIILLRLISDNYSVFEKEISASPEMIDRHKKDFLEILKQP